MKRIRLVDLGASFFRRDGEECDGLTGACGVELACPLCVQCSIVSHRVRVWFNNRGSSRDGYDMRGDGANNITLDGAVSINSDDCAFFFRLTNGVVSIMDRPGSY